MILSTARQLHTSSPIEKALIDTTKSWNEENENEIKACLRHLVSAKDVSSHSVKIEELH